METQVASEIKFKVVEQSCRVVAYSDNDGGVDFDYGTLTHLVPFVYLSSFVDEYLAENPNRMLSAGA